MRFINEICIKCRISGKLMNHQPDHVSYTSLNNLYSLHNVSGETWDCLYITSLLVTSRADEPPNLVLKCLSSEVFGSMRSEDSKRMN